MATKATCTRCGRVFIGHGALCVTCEKIVDREARAKADREFRHQRRADAKREGPNAR
jgi:hypothetical protein